MSLLSESETALQMERNLEMAALAFQQAPGPETWQHLQRVLHAWRSKEWVYAALMRNLTALFTYQVGPTITTTAILNLASWTPYDAVASPFRTLHGYNLYLSSPVGIFNDGANEGQLIRFYSHPTFTRDQYNSIHYKTLKDACTDNTAAEGPRYELQVTELFSRPYILSETETLTVKVMNYGGVNLGTCHFMLLGGI